MTAQRRSESIQKVPLTIQAFLGDTLAKLNVKPFDDLVKLTPNVTFGNNGPGQGAISTIARVPPSPNSKGAIPISTIRASLPICASTISQALGAFISTEPASTGRTAPLHRQDAQRFPSHRADPPAAAERDDHRHAAQSDVLLVQHPETALRPRQEFTYSIPDIARYYRTYLDLMEHWDAVLSGRVLSVRHADVAEDPQGSVRRILDPCGLPFEQACVDFYRTRRAVRTPSSEQVRQPIFRDGFDQWTRYAEWLEPLRAALGDAVERYRAEAIGAAYILHTRKALARIPSAGAQAAQEGSVPCLMPIMISPSSAPASSAWPMRSPPAGRG